MIKNILSSSIRKMSTNTSKGVELNHITKYLKSFAPMDLAENWDNIGILVEPVTPRLIHNVMLTNDLTEDVALEAVNLNAELIISYHPPIFKPLTRVTTSSWKERVIGICMENRIAIYSPHTSWDSVPGGVNDWLTEAFDSEYVKPIIESHIIPNSGKGRFCLLKNKIPLKEAVENVKNLTSLKFLNVAIARGASLDTKIKNVAVCAGSGSSLLQNVKADLYLTGEMSHHSLLDAVHNGTNVILCNHSNSERGFLNKFGKKLEKEFVSYEIKVLISEKDRDPLQTV